MTQEPDRPLEYASPAAMRRALGRQLATARETAHYTAEQLAKTTGFSICDVSEAETGWRNPPAGFLAACESVLGIQSSLTAGYERLARLRISEASRTAQQVIADLGCVAKRIPGAAGHTREIADMLERLSTQLDDAAILLRSSGT